MSDLDQLGHLFVVRIGMPLGFALLAVDEQMIDLLRTSVTVKVVIVPPHDDGAPRR